MHNQRREFHRQVPFPINAKTESAISGDLQNELRELLRKKILEGYTLKENIERDYRQHRHDKTFEANSQGGFKFQVQRVNNDAAA